MSIAGHAKGYVPTGLLYHVDDAWELARMAARNENREIAGAARDDLAMLRLRWVRGKAGIERIRERRGMVIALVRGPARLLLARLPGRDGKVLRIRL
jgi:hypothetical protein